MLYFPNAKINIGLRVLRKRSIDEPFAGYHDIESVFLPVPWYDVLEIVESRAASKFTFTGYGLPIQGNPNDNLIAKAYNILEKDFSLPHVHINLLKQIPMGAGMGGGSSDAASALVAFNNLFNLNMDHRQLKKYASQIGADCSFFIDNQPALVSGVGENIDTDMIIQAPSNYILIVYPPFHISTAEAYQHIKLNDNYSESLRDIILQPIDSWKESIHNDFESYAILKFPEIQEIKNKMYAQGALYVSMTGSGSAVYGFFNHISDLKFPSNYICKWLDIMERK